MKVLLKILTQFLSYLKLQKTSINKNIYQYVNLTNFCKHSIISLLLIDLSLEKGINLFVLQEMGILLGGCLTVKN